MGGLFGNAPEAPKQTPRPAIDEQAEEEARREAQAGRRGRRATIFTGSQGATPDKSNVKRPTLLGGG